jgi:hypothetical protein
VEYLKALCPEFWVLLATSRETVKFPSTSVYISAILDLLGKRMKEK